MKRYHNFPSERFQYVRVQFHFGFSVNLQSRTIGHRNHDRSSRFYHQLTSLKKFMADFQTAGLAVKRLELHIAYYLTNGTPKNVLYRFTAISIFTRIRITTSREHQRKRQNKHYTQ